MTTPRLAGERPCEEHLPFLVELFRDPLVVETLWPGERPRTPEQTRAMLGEWIAHWEEHGFGRWVFRHREAGEPVGRGGLSWTELDGERVVEVGYAVSTRRWGLGFATEMAVASVEYAFGTVGLDEVIAFTLVDNLPSLRVMEKSGFAYERDIVRAGFPHALYRVRAGAASGAA